MLVSSPAPFCEKVFRNTNIKMIFPLKMARANAETILNGSALPQAYKKQTAQAPKNLCGYGRGSKFRTHGTRFWRPLLYQLSYTPIGIR